MTKTGPGQKTDRDTHEHGGRFAAAGAGGGSPKVKPLKADQLKAALKRRGDWDKPRCLCCKSSEQACSKGAKHAPAFEPFDHFII
jgi:hypothetical protein